MKLHAKAEDCLRPDRKPDEEGRKSVRPARIASDYRLYRRKLDDLANMFRKHCADGHRRPETMRQHEVRAQGIRLEMRDC